MHQIGDFGEGIGHCDRPNPYVSWLGLPSTQLTSNGGSRSPMISNQDNSIQRLKTINESMAIASLPDDYKQFTLEVHDDDKFTRKCINNGVPMQTGTAIALQVYNHLDQCRLRQSPSPTVKEAIIGASKISTTQHDTPILRSMMLDLGASGSLNYTDVEQHMWNKTRSKYRIDVAMEGASMNGSADGQLTIQVLNTNNAQGFKNKTSMTYNTTTADQLRTELFSFDDHYRKQKFNLIIRQPDYEDGNCELYRPAMEINGVQMKECRVPVRYDYHGIGGWWIDYIIHPNPQQEHIQLLANMVETTEINDNQVDIPSYTVDQSHKVLESLSKETCITGMECNNVVTITARQPDEREFKGVKSGLKRSMQRMEGKAFHKKFGHIGNCQGECWICNMVKGVMKRYTLKISPYRETRVGYLWYMDGVTWSHRSLKGNKYMVTLRDVASKALFKLCLYLRSDITYHLETFISKLRANPAFHGLTYRVFSMVITDNAGEWCRQCANWQAFEVQMQFETKYTTPETSKELGMAEISNKTLEIHTKAFLMERNLPPNHWEICANAAEFCLLRFPPVAAEITAPVDGDQERPLEKLLRGYKSRRQIDRELSAFEPPGQIALVHFKTKGSSIEPRVRWAVAWEMYNEQVVWRCPFSKSLFRSKSFSTITMQDNMNYGHFFGIEMESSRAQISLPGDMTDKIDIHLDGPRQIDKAPEVPVTDIVDNDGNVKHIDIRRPSKQDLGGSVRVYDSLGRQLMFDDKTGELHTTGGTKYDDKNSQRAQDISCEQDIMTSRENLDLSGTNEQVEIPNDPDSEAMPSQSDPASAKTDRQQVQTRQTDKNHSDQFQKTNTNQTMGIDNDRIDYFGDDDSDTEDWNESNEFHDIPTQEKDEEQEALDKIARIFAERDQVTAGASLSFEKLCKHSNINIPHEMHDCYYKWLMEQQTDMGMRFSQETIPRSRPKLKGGGYIEPGTKIPPPNGERWREILEESGLKRSDLNKQRVIKANVMIKESVIKINEAVKKLHDFCKHNDEDTQETIEAFAAKKLHKVKKRKMKATATVGDKQAPKSIEQALRNPDREEAFKWLESINKEWNDLNDLGILQHDLTWKELNKMGITTKPIPFSICLDYKFDDKGEVDRYKTRFAVAGHSGNLQKGVHFDSTYASTPSQNSTRLLMAIMVRFRMRRLAFDISMAYCNADLPDGQKIAIRYPNGFKRFKTIDGINHELFMVLIRNLYGHPAAGRHWEKTRNKGLMDDFHNKGPWTIKQCIKEPCLFIINLKKPHGTERVFALIHTDDCDMIGDNDEILMEVYNIVNKRWKSKLVDASFMLGIKRTIYETPQEMTVTMTMQAFIEGMASAFKDYILKRDIDTPLPPNLFMHKQTTKTDDTRETTRKILDRGFQRLFGMLLWAARGVFPEAVVATSMTGRLMADPTEEAWDALCWLLTYMYQRKSRGIRFSSRGNCHMICYVDASNKPDPTDGKAQFGYVIMIQGGPMVSVSKKANHVGQSASHNEYMAITHAAKHVAWARDLLSELGLEEMCPKPTTVWGDNKAANLLSHEDIITCGNQFIQLPYHYTKQEVEAGNIQVLDIVSEDNVADLTTKAYTRQVADKLIPQMTGYVPLPYPSQRRAKKSAASENKSL